MKIDEKTAKALNELYAEQNKEQYPNDVKRRINTVCDKAFPFLKELPEPNRIIDICCGNCYIGERLGATEFYDYYASNKKVKFCDFIRHDMLIEIEGQVNGILLFHCLEHFINPKKVIKFLSNYLAPSGIIIIAVPLGDEDNNHQPYNKKIGHISTFNKDSIGQLIFNGIELEAIFEFNQNNFKEYLLILRKSGN